MLNEIGSWRRHEDSGGFVGSRRREEPREPHFPLAARSAVESGGFVNASPLIADNQCRPPGPPSAIAALHSHNGEIANLPKPPEHEGKMRQGKSLIRTGWPQIRASLSPS